MTCGQLCLYERCVWLLAWSSGVYERTQRQSESSRINRVSELAKGLEPVQASHLSHCLGWVVLQNSLGI
ncbi:hypothetical protein PF005_g5221 [Phytophthora fragariae]|uniref:Uncharacterized protein n=1 Tax=Phytophthora fragariae TaxID=53985 RepID=A0A6A3T2T8_9STRA|nr:hypothetical protein PF003_g2705 [Phytophthora fragariae]KAE8944764.1 hypothetical protein PF009_g5553 [Phytophthora fragariae]KAE9023037.1 hypothetical protein PF011_g4170 [Phytophthora fragariae]KAE9128506.1 hypothetical protein PF007_g5230 [Phytophthora fragariae]KAE9128637.1 hypothetical protein PF010_g4424 [Phytophthora fragariae]